VGGPFSNWPAVLAILLFDACLVEARAGGAATSRDRSFEVSVAGTRTVPIPFSPSQINLQDPKVLDVKLLPRNQLLLSGKKVGQTEVTIWDGQNDAVRYVVQVVVPFEGLEGKLATVLPGEALRVSAVGNAIILHGMVADAVSAERARKVAEAHLQGLGLDAKVLSFIKVGGRQQVQLRVKIAEVSRTALRQMGVNFFHRSDARSGGLLAPGSSLGQNTAPDLGQTGTTLQPGGTLTPAGGVSPPLPLISTPFGGDAFGLLFATQATAAFPLSIAVSLLQSTGLAKILSEPTLVAYTGQEAKFLAGGEFPVPIPQALGQTSIEYKKFGVQLTFTPLVLTGGSIHLKLSVTVSEKDQSGAVTIQGTSVPALITRTSETTVRLKNGQSFAIAGLMQDRIESFKSKIPLLGDLPLIGMAFRRVSFRRTESELVVLVTARLVQPLSPGQVPPLPGEDELSDPSSFAFFLLGTTDAKIRDERRASPAGPVGFTQ
jgi:pilus assembly protein CpaC